VILAAPQRENPVNGAQAAEFVTIAWKQNFMPGIKDKIVAITGASSGVGEATAVMLAERGAKVVLGARDWIGLTLSLVGSRERVARSQNSQIALSARPS
jgi:hypothetical protein